MKQITLSLFLFGAALLYGCYPNEITSTEELDIVLTDHVPSEFTPNSHLTYYIPDSVGLFANETPDGWDANETRILNDIRRNMTNYGYTYVDRTASPDVVFIPEVMLVDTYVVGGGGYCYWWWYDPWCYGGGYYPPYYGYSYSTGTILMNIISTENIDGEDPTDDIIWTAVINGLLRDNPVNASSLITKYIDQAFSQSDYLEITN